MTTPNQNTTSDDTASWRERLRRLMKPPRRLSFTKSGKFFVLMTLGVGFGAINTGNNLLFLLLGLMLSLIIASGLLSEAVIRYLKPERDPPRRLFAGRSSPGVFVVENPSRWPSLSIEVCERRAVGEVGPLAGARLGPKRPPWWKFWRGTSSGDSRLDDPIAAAYTMRVESGSREELPTRYRFPERGRYELSGLQLVTRFPFGLFEKRREFDQPDVLVVFPAPRSAESWTAEVHARFGDVAQSERGPGEEYFGLRDYRPGEDQRLIHWKSSARRGEVVVRETERQEQRSVEICLLNCTAKPASARHLVQPAFEDGLERVVGLIDALGRAGYRVGLRTLDDHLPADDTANHHDRMLSTLALAELRDGAHAMPLDDGATDHTGRILVGLDRAVASGGRGFDLVLSFENSQFDDHVEAA